MATLAYQTPTKEKHCEYMPVCIHALRKPHAKHIAMAYVPIYR